ncbi:MAG: beta strand repeat-containing protein, partial [Dolichospermum sp.]
ATIGTDYTGIATAGTTKTVTFAAGSSTATVTVDPTADTTVESDETVILTLASGTGYTIGTPAQTEQYASTVIYVSSEWSEGSWGWGAVQILGQPNTLSYGDFPTSWAPEPANADGDLQADEFITVGFATPVYASGIEVRETYGNGFVRSIDLLSNQGTYYSVWSGIDTSMPGLPVDFRINFDQTSYLVVGARINVDIDHTSGWEEIDSVKLIGTTGAVTGTITNDDFPSITLAVSPNTVTEDGTPNLIYTFTRTGVTTNALTVNYTVGGTATIGTDYTGIATTGTTKTVTFAAGSSTATVTVDPTADTTIESDETVILTLASGTGYTIGNTSEVTGTITNDDFPSVTLAVSPTSVTEDGTPNLIYTFTRTGVTTNALTVNYTVGGTATIGTDYTGIATAEITKTVTFAAGSSTATVTVDPTADTTIESDETVILTLASGTGYTIGTTSEVTGTITNDETQVTLAVSPNTVTEDGTSNLIYTFTRTGVTTNALTVNYTVGGTATIGTDYTGIATAGTTKTVTFAAGSSTATVTVDPTADTTVESDETVI